MNCNKGSMCEDVVREHSAFRWMLCGVTLGVMLLSASANARPWKTYTFKEKDSLSTIAAFYGVDVADLRKANRIGKRDVLWAGRILRIPAVLSDVPNRIHVIRPGDTLNAISKKHDVSVHALTLANRLDDFPLLYPGRELIIPLEDGNHNPVFKPEWTSARIRSVFLDDDHVTQVVHRKQTIWTIANAYKKIVQYLAKTSSSHLDEAIFQAKSPTVISGYKTTTSAPAGVTTYLPVHFIRLRNNQQITLSLLNKNGKVDKESRRLLSILAGRDGQRTPRKLFHPDLIRVIQLIADQFPGKSIQVISGYRPKNRRDKRGRKRNTESYHSLGRAIDFRVVGVSPREVYRFIKQLPNVGAGFYPKARFVHVDVRKEKTLWVDDSRAGEPSHVRKIIVFKQRKDSDRYMRIVKRPTNG
jgi:uncharacterized protein YcbK (DUF882 family)/LysM repeat protein